MDFRKRATIGAIVSVIMWFVVRLPFYYTGRIGDDAILMKTDHMQFPCPLTAGEERALTRSWYWARRLPVAVPVTPPDYILKTGDRSLRIWRAARVACDEKEVLFNLPPGSCILLDDVIIRLETMLADRFGELMPWDEVKAYFAMYCRAEIIDLETGKSFRVQRRGGRYHVDCQPLTRDDTR